MVEFLERHQIPVYLAALLLGATVGLAAPGIAPGLQLAIYPVLGLLLYATFLQLPFTTIARSVRDVRFLSAVLVLNFVLVPLVVAPTSLLPLPEAVRLGVLLTLLAPCVDYVIVFSGLAGGDSTRLLAASPLLMLGQILALPPLLLLLLGPGLVDVVEIGPFLGAFGILIVGPLGLAWATETLGTRHRAGRTITSGMNAAMVPLMAATLLVVVGSQVPAIGDRLGQVGAVVGLYTGFLVVMTGVGWVTARMFRFDAPAARALVFSGATRNSLVVLAPALALPTGYAITAVIVVTQTLVELVGMVVLVRLLPRLVPA